MDFDDILKNNLGEFGTYQILIVLFVCSVGMNSVFNTIDYTFIGVTPAFWCDDVNITHLKDNFTREELNRLISPENSAGVVDACVIYERNYSLLTVEHVRKVLRNSSTDNLVALPTLQCSSWEYSHEQFTSSFVTQWDLVCDKEWLVATSQSIFMAGKLTVIIIGWLSDRFGRRRIALAMFCLHMISRTMTGLAVNYYMFVIGRFFMAVASTNWYTAVFVISIEMVGPRWRALAGQAPNFFWSLGYMILAVVAYFIRDWRVLTLGLLVFAVPYVLHFWLLPESIRWLMVNGKSKEANKLMKQMARINKKELPEKIELMPTNEKTEDNPEEVKTTICSGFMGLLKSWHWMKITIILLYLWFTITFSYYGLIFYIPKLGGDIYVNTLISGAIEMTAIIIVQITLDTRLGRRMCSLIAFLTSGVSLIGIMFVPKGIDWLIVTLAMIGRFAVSYIFSVIFIYTSEIYPTALRTISLSVCATFARVGGVIAPYLILLTSVSTYLPPVLMGSMAIVAGFLCLFLPETKGQPLVDTLKPDPIEDKPENTDKTMQLLGNNKLGE